MNLKPSADNTIVLKSRREIAIMREAGVIVAAVIRALAEQAEPGMTTKDLDQIAARYRGYVADSTGCFAVGGLETLPDRVRELVKVTEEALFRGIEQARAGNRLSDIGAAIGAHVSQNGMSVVRDFVGHGVGRNMHEAPQVHHHGPPGRGPVLREGMCLAIEPQVNLGSAAVRMLQDGWTAVTVDGSLSAHFEHTVAVTANGPDILTLPCDDGRVVGPG